MKHIKIITLSIIIFICCLYPVASDDVNGDENDTNLTDVDSVDSVSLGSHGKKWPHFSIDAASTFNVGDDMRFHVTCDPSFDRPIHVNLDDYYQTTVTTSTGQFYITFPNTDLSHGWHFFKVEYEGDDQWYYEGCAVNFKII